MPPGKARANVPYPCVRLSPVWSFLFKWPTIIRVAMVVIFHLFWTNNKKANDMSPAYSDAACEATAIAQHGQIFFLSA